MSRSISEGEAPGQAALTTTTGKTTFGLRLAPSDRYDRTPNAATAMKNIETTIGFLMQKRVSHTRTAKLLRSAAHHAPAVLLMFQSRASRRSPRAPCIA